MDGDFYIFGALSPLYFLKVDAAQSKRDKFSSLCLYSIS
jgi:hypothetical protein